MGSAGLASGRLARMSEAALDQREVQLALRHAQVAPRQAGPGWVRPPWTSLGLGQGLAQPKAQGRSTAAPLSALAQLLSAASPL